MHKRNTQDPKSSSVIFQINGYAKNATNGFENRIRAVFIFVVCIHVIILLTLSHTSRK